MPPDATTVDEEMAGIFRADQGDRRGYGLLGGLALMAGLFRKHSFWLAARDEQRLQRVLALHAAGGLVEPKTRYHAAMVLQHGRAPEHYRLAHEFAKSAGEKGVEDAEWLSRAAYDRWMLATGKPQVHGTQFPEFLFRRRITQRCRGGAGGAVTQSHGSRG